MPTRRVRSWRCAAIGCASRSRRARSGSTRSGCCRRSIRSRRRFMADELFDLIALQSLTGAELEPIQRNIPAVARLACEAASQVAAELNIDADEAQARRIAEVVASALAASYADGRA